MQDQRTICWDPLSDTENGEVVTELPSAGNWVFDVKWCPRDPGVVATASFDGTVSVYSVLASQSNSGTAEPAGSGSSLPEMARDPSSSQLAHAPKWLKRPVGASFGFGGKLARFSTT